MKGFGRPTEPVWNLSSNSAKESTTAGPPLVLVKADICSANECVGDQIRPQITARRKMQLAGCEAIMGLGMATARGCGGPELYHVEPSPFEEAEAEGGLEGFFPNAWVVPHRICPRGLIIPHHWRFCYLIIVYAEDVV